MREGAEPAEGGRVRLFCEMHIQGNAENNKLRTAKPTLIEVPLPGKQAEVDRIAKEWIDLHRSKKATNGYQTFRTIFGGEPGYVVVNWGKDELDFVTKSKQTNELFGEEAAKLWQRTMAITHKVYFKNAWYLPDLSYYPAPVTAK